jgi:DNA-binding response OmpR family regulator
LARLDPSTTQGKSEGELSLSVRLRPRTGLTLLVAGPSVELAAVVQALKSRGLRPALAPVAESVTEIASRWIPRVTVVWAGADGWRSLLRFLDRREVPVVLIGTEQQLRSCDGSAIRLELFAPATVLEIADAVETLIGPASISGLPAAIELERVQVDVPARKATVEGELVDLPPKMFDMLVELALQPGHPIKSRELLRRLWPGSPRATTDDVNWHASQLRKLIGDHDRAVPLIENRRGFGYVLNDLPTG